MSDDLLVVFDSLPVYFIMKKGGMNCYPASVFTHHAVIFKRELLFYGVRIQNNFEHEWLTTFCYWFFDNSAIDLYDESFLLYIIFRVF